MDGTLFPSNTWKPLAKHYLKYLKGFLFLVKLYITHYHLWLLSKLRICNRDKLDIKWMEDIAGLMTGLTETQMQCLASLIVKNDVLGKLRQDVMERLKEHRARGHFILLASGAYQPLLDAIGSKIGADRCIGTALEFTNGRYTGRITKPFLLGSEKAEKIKAFISQCGASIDLPLSYAYSDSIRDLPTLNLVGNPIAVYPDEQLELLAKQKGWDLIE
ncbi:Phosphoserine phosphatase SerB1 [subsurface metagenome]